MTEDIDQLRIAISDPEQIASRPFELLAELSALLSIDSTEGVARDLLVRAREHIDLFGAERIILEALLRQAGLFPYVDATMLGAADALAFEVHRPPGFDGSRCAVLPADAALRPNA
jgi:hypothetical protein